MSETELKITVTTEWKELQDLVNKLNSGNITVAEYNKTLRELRNVSIVGSKEQMNLKNVVEQVGNATATANGKMMKSYFSTGEELRRFYREQRVGDRTMREATQAAAGLGQMMGGDGLGKIVGTLTGGFQQAEFSINAAGIAAQSAGGKVAGLGRMFMSISIPLAIIAAAYALISTKIAEADKKAEEFVNKQKERLTEWFGLLKEIRDIGDKDDKLEVQEKVLTRLKERLQDAKSVYEDYRRTGEQTSNEGLKAEKEYLFALKAVSDQENHISDIKKKALEEEQRVEKIVHEQFMADLNERTEAWDEFSKRQAGLITGTESFYDKTIGRDISTLSVSTEGSFVQGLPGTVQPGKRKEKWEEGQTTLKVPPEKEVNKLEKGIIKTKVLADILSGSIRGLGSDWTQAVNGMISGTQNIGQGFAAMSSAVVAAIGRIIAEMLAMQALTSIFSVFGLGSLFGLGSAAGGGTVLSGAGGGGSALLASVRTPVGGGFTPSNISMMNQMSQSSRGGGNAGTAQMAKAINDLNANVARLSAANENTILMMTKSAAQVRNEGTRF